MSWIEFKIKEIINHFQNGYAFNASNYIDVGIPIISMQSISLEGKFQLSENNNCWDEKEKERLANFILNKGDLIMSMTDVTPQRNLIGCSTIIDREGVFFLNQRVGKIEADENKVNVNFLDFYFKSNYWRNYCRRISSLSVQANIGTRDILNGKIKLPPKPEQTAIATILSKVDEAIATAQNSIKAAEKLKKALMQNLLTGKLKPDGSWRAEDEFYEDEKFGKYPKDWNFSRFKDFAVLQRGKDLTDNEVIKGELPVVISNGVQICHNQFFVEPPGVVTGRSGTIGKAFYIEERFWAHNTSLYVKDFKGNYPKYIYYLILRMDFRRYYAGTTVPTLNRNDIHRLKIAIPKTEKEQKEIADKIDDSDKSLESKQTKIQTLQRLKKSLMQNLLTGKVRLPQEFIAQFNTEEPIN